MVNVWEFVKKQCGGCVGSCKGSTERVMNCDTITYIHNTMMNRCTIHTIIH